MQTCPACRVEYPDGCVQPLVLANRTAMRCGVCQLQAMRRVMGDPHAMFNGIACRKNYEACLQWRKHLEKLKRETPE
jgi:hypothetical protein